MKKLFAFLFLAIALILCIFLFIPTHHPQVQKENIPTSTQIPLPTSHISQTILFVPYWATTSIMPGFSTYIYFGITPNNTGIDTTDTGYKNMHTFVAATKGNTTLLTVRMLSGANTQKALQDSSLAEHIMQDTIQIAHAYGFSGVVLDLEYSGFAFPSVTKQVTDFSTRFAKEVQTKNLLFYQALYGDSFYLARPFAVKEIAKSADGIFVMSYDFHKANGTPGPNFPLLSRADADYNFTDMVHDFLTVTPKEKITVVFGMFGYDWIIDEKGRAEKTAESLSDTDVSAKFLAHCLVKNCAVHRIIQTQEPSVTYTDANGENHIVWFEDMQSIIPKEKILEQNGISHVGLWANGYF